jgi:dihydropteroate synthase
VWLFGVGRGVVFRLRRGAATVVSGDRSVYCGAVKSLRFEDRPVVMGILNVTPDSFSDGGRYADPERAIAHGLRMIEEGADIIDVGGESTRPGSAPVSAAVEIERVVPVIRGLLERADVAVSVDTVKPEVAEAAVAAGARMINDVSGLRGGPELAEVAAASGADLVLMHSRGTPSDMQADPAHLEYSDVVADAIAELEPSVERALGAGVSRERIWLDPGIGFAKTAAQNLELMARLEELAALGYPVLVGPSRKSFIGTLTGAPTGERLGGTAAAVAISILHGARGVRVHDVAEMRQAASIAAALRDRRRAPRRVADA